MGRDDCLRSLRMLLREVVRNVKHDMVFHTFATSLMHDQSDAKLRDLDPILKVVPDDASFLPITATTLCLHENAPNLTS